MPEVWVLSPDAETLEVLHLHDGRLVTTVLLKDGSVAPLRFPAATVDIAAIWAEAKWKRRRMPKHPAPNF